jgi:voltage-gated potassium channel
MDTSPKAGEARVGPFQIVILILSVLVLVALVADTIFKLPNEISRILQAVDLFICVAFFVDFCVRFWKAESKLIFMKWGWIDLAACVPNIDVLRLGRLVRVLRLTRLLRGVRSLHRLLHLFFQNKRQGGFASVILTTFLLIVFSSVAILICEREPESNIKSAEDAVWWSVTTVTTVGYGDKYPVTTEGRIIAMVLMLSGVGLFGTLSGLVASFFLGAKQDEEEAELKEMLARLNALDAKLAERKSENGEE